ncbi:MAG TPA: ABC transporter permease [Steroidobacteraceae bacterium]|jgi:putative ABC transport system permease protein|nr:ABC transporter permease [Steroidobacteraceae bacterium]
MFIDIEKWQEIFNTLSRHKLRTALTAFGVFWGIFMLTVLLGAGKGLENGVAEGFPKNTNTVWIWQQGTTQIPFQGMPIGRDIALRPENVEAIARNVPSVGFITGQNSVGVWDKAPPYTVRKSRNGAFSIQGGFAGMERINSVRIIQGRSFNPLDEPQKRKVAVIGQRVRDQLFAKDENPLGEDITINGITFQVVGVFRSTQNGNQQQEEERIYLPNETLRYSFNQIGRIGSFVIVPKPGIHARVVENDVKMYLAQINKVSPVDKGVFGSFNLQDEHDKVQGLFTGIKVFSWMVAIGTIFAGAVGVGNIMLIVVKERTREIGLRKALGATPASIVAMIMQESVFITAVAGYSGLVMATLLLETIASALNAAGGRAGFMGPPEIEFRTAMTALIVLVVSGLLASLMPAAKAAAVNPIIALQDE